jgi:hypothetical protein
MGVFTLGYNKKKNPILFGFHSMNPNYIKECIKIIGEHNRHENLITIWDEPIKMVQPLRLNQMK